MSAPLTTTTTTTEIQEATSPAIAFSDDSSRGRVHSVTPLIEEDTVGEIPEELKSKRGARSSLAAFAERLRSRSRSHSRHRSANNDEDLSLDRTSTQASGHSFASFRSNSSRRSSKSRSGSRSGRNSLDEPVGPYADVVRAQNEFMDNLRAEQERNNITHNADGIPIPRSPPTSRSGSRRSSITHILGLDKPLLAF